MWTKALIEPVQNKEGLRTKINQQMEDFIAKGGKVETVDTHFSFDGDVNDPRLEAHKAFQD